MLKFNIQIVKHTWHEKYFWTLCDSFQFNKNYSEKEITILFSFTIKLILIFINILILFAWTIKLIVLILISITIMIDYAFKDLDDFWNVVRNVIYTADWKKKNQHVRGTCMTSFPRVLECLPYVSRYFYIVRPNKNHSSFN